MHTVYAGKTLLKNGPFFPTSPTDLPENTEIQRITLWEIVTIPGNFFTTA